VPTTRRELLGTAAATSAALWLPPTARGARTVRADVAIVGAGLAGLAAARRLVRAGRDVVVLEARDRVGGRTLNHDLGNGVIAEAGGQFAGPTQTRVLALARSMGVGTFKTYNSGDNVLVVGGRRSTYAATPGLSNDADFQALTFALLKLDPLAASVPVAAPWRAKRAAEWDRRSFGAWADGELKTPGARALLAAAIRALWGTEPSEVSLLYALWYVAAAGDERHPGSVTRLLTTPGGAQESRFVGGSQRIAIEVAKRLGSRVMLGRPVTRVERVRGGLRVVARGLEVHARRVVVAVPPVLAARIAFSPALPAAKRAVLRAAVPGTLLKSEAVYDRPFWRDAGLSGQAVSDTGPANTTFDNTPPSGSPGIVLGFVGGREARTARATAPAAHRDAFLANLVTYFGDGAAQPVDFFTQDWTAEAWTRGCPVGHFATGRLRRLGPALRTAVGPIHFAGAETATYWNGYMDGAVRSGERAADEILGS
jgi:monoamine oxidase